MTITVHYTAQLRRLTGTTSEQVELAASCSLADLLALLQKEHAMTVPASTLLFVNDVQADDPAGTVLREGDVVTLLSPIAGGQPG